MTVGNEAARGSCSYARAKVSTVTRDTDIVHENWERGTFWAGIAVALSFGPMLVWAAVMW